MAKRILFLGLLINWLSIAADTPRPFGAGRLAFEPNRGQWRGADFGTHARGFTALFKGGDVTYLLPAGSSQTVVKSHWIGGTSPQTLAPANLLPGVANYYGGTDRSRWIAGVPTYAQLRLVDLYPGIDLVYYGNLTELEYDLVVAPGADTRRLGLSFEHGSPRLDKAGNLILDSGGTSFLQHRPVAYQEIGGKRTAVSARYVIADDGDVRFDVGTYDRSRPLVIDPTIAWVRAFVSGSVGSINVFAVAVDSAGSAWITGSTNATDLPTANPYQSSPGNSQCCTSDAYVTKLSPDGATVLFSTYFGGSESDAASSIALDGSGNAVITGWTGSSNFPVTASGLQRAYHGGADAFVAKFGASGGLLWSTYFGGTQYDAGTGVAIDSSGNVYVTGVTSSTDLIIKGGFQQTSKAVSGGFVAKLAPDGGSVVFSTYLSGSSFDSPNAIALGPGNTVFVAGTTKSTDFPTANPYQATGGGGTGSSGFLTKLAASGGSLIYSTFLAGGVGQPATQIAALDVDPSGAAYVTGLSGGGLPLKNPSQSATAGVYLTKFSADGASLVYSTYLGGGEGAGIRVDSTGSAVVVGSTDASNFPTVGAFRSLLIGTDAFVTQFNASGGITFSSFLGGSSDDGAEGVALDASGNIYVTGYTLSSDFAAPASPVHSAAFVVKLSGATVTVPVTFSTVPAGLLLTVDGVITVAPFVFHWAPGTSHTMAAPSPQSSTGPTANNFLSWSNGGAQQQTVTAPSAAAAYTASFDSQACQYSFTPPFTATYGQGGGNSYISVTSPAGCPWNATSSASWVVLANPNAAGSDSLRYTVEANPASGSRTATVSVGSATFTITQTNSIPRPSLNSVCCGTGATQLIRYTVLDNDGTGNLTVSNLLINNFLDGRQACYMAYDHQNSVLYLVNDAGTALLPGLRLNVPGQGGIISNSQCSIDASQSSTYYIPGTTTLVSLSLTVTFSPTFAGSKVMYLAARDKAGANSGWQPLGVLEVPSGAAAAYPAVKADVSPNSGSSFQVSVTYTDAADNANLTPSQILINDALDGRNACYMGYDHKNNLLYLLDDSGTKLLAAITPGLGAATQQNSQCRSRRSGRRRCPTRPIVKATCFH